MPSLLSVNHGCASTILVAVLLSASVPLARAWTAANGTALRPVLIWACLALGLAVGAQICGLVAEPAESGRPWTGRLTYLSTLASLAALLSVLNARTPGAGAWALLMAMLVVVFLIPWLEEPGRFRQAQGLRSLRLDAPWTIFFGLLAGTGVTNYLPTRYGPAAISLGLGFFLEYLSLTRADWSSDARIAAWSGYAWCLAAALWVAYLLARRVSTRERLGVHALDAMWLWFRDHWGVVWGLRISERFNRAAELSRWPCRLGWFGTTGAVGSGLDPAANTVVVPDSAVSTFRGLLRRFAKPERLERIRGFGSE